LPKFTDPNVLVGLDSPDDAAVYRVREDLAIVQTVDYFTPVVDDPYTFGQIAAANSLSDIYTMGTQPLFALNVIGYPAKQLPMDYLVEILRGGADKAAEAGIAIIGGHTIEDKEPKYGLVVTGVIHPEHILTKSTAKPGDVLILTKPLGLGVITTGIKRGEVCAEDIQQAILTMATLNKAAAEVMLEVGVSACTDITGFGLLGHLREMAAGSGVSATIYSKSVPVLDAAWPLVEKGIIPGGSKKNLQFLQSYLENPENVSPETLLLLADAQTSGGLLMAVSEEKADQMVRALKGRKDVLASAVIGHVTAGPVGTIKIVP